ncbi:MAG: hypothetical protein ACTSVY_07410 [Candidatus Helarchaeota archaeon]
MSSKFQKAAYVILVVSAISSFLLFYFTASGPMGTSNTMKIDFGNGWIYPIGWVVSAAMMSVTFIMGALIAFILLLIDVIKNSDK